MTSDSVSSLAIPLALCLCIIYAILTILINNYANLGKQPWIHQSSVAALLGLFIGFVLNELDFPITFNNDIFFYLVLPPIIFAAGYTLKKKKFFMYIQRICVFGILGEFLISCLSGDLSSSW